MKCERIVAVCLGMLIIGGGFLQAEETASELKPSVEVIGVQVVSKGYDHDQKWNRYKTIPFNAHHPGIEVALGLSYPAGGIIEMDDDQSELIAFRDDHKTDLLVKEESVKFANKPGFGSFPKVVNDGKGILFTVKSAVAPAPGTRLVGLSGNIALITGSTQETVKAKDVSLNVGTKFKLGAFDFEISKVGKPEWGDAPLAVTFKLTKKLDGVIGFAFHAADGAEIESSEGGSSSMSMGAMVQVEKSFNFKKQVAGPVTVSMTYWTDMKNVKVPFRIKTGLMP